MQNVVYGEYLPTVLGVEVMRRYGLIVEEESRYDPEVDPTIVNEFATAAFRYGPTTYIYTHLYLECAKFSHLSITFSAAELLRRIFSYRSFQFQYFFRSPSAAPRTNKTFSVKKTTTPY